MYYSLLKCKVYSDLKSSVRVTYDVNNIDFRSRVLLFSNLDRMKVKYFLKGF